MSQQVRPLVIDTPRGTFAALTARPASGVSERQPALLVPGYTGSKEDFLAILESLAAAGRSVVAIDMRGQYQSAPAAGKAGYEPDQLANDLVAVAAAIATDADLEQLKAMIGQVWHGQLRPQAEAEGTPPEIIEFLTERALLSCPLGLAEMARHLLNCPDRTDDLAALQHLPKLVSYGENDDAWPPDVQDLMAKRLGAERVCIPGAAHSPAVEAPETTAAMLTAFWNQAESGR